MKTLDESRYKCPYSMIEYVGLLFSGAVIVLYTSVVFVPGVMAFFKSIIGLLN